MKKRSNQKGITLTELMVALVLMGVVLAVGYNLVHFTQKTYSDSEKKWIAQSNTRQAAEFITSELKTAFYAKINYSGEMEEEDIQLFIDDGKLFHKKYDAEPSQITDGRYSITFEKAKTNTWTEESGGDDRLNNTITFTINALDTDGEAVLYTLETSVYLENMLEERAISGNYTGNRVRYKRTSEDSPIPTEFGISKCFIATAAYDSPNDSSVLLLRRFRDEILLTNAPGRAFVDFYYRISPPIAEYISHNGLLKFIVRLLLTPFVGFAGVFLYPELMALCLGMILLWQLRRNQRHKPG